ncbi:hypothetical protein L7F22_031424 [Adiantum nelumboides]|nr:hypothetical protein [Adiantum nelumboides]
MLFVKESKEGACVLKESRNETKEEPNLADLLNEFQDVFINELLRELSPIRGQDDHTTELLPSSSTPNKPSYRVSPQAQQEEIMRQVNKLVEKGMDVDPTYFEEAAENANWQEAINEKMDALYGNEMWELMPLPKSKKSIGSTWVYKVKHNSDGSVSRYKARLVAKGYAQTYDADHSLYLQKIDAGIVIITIYVDDLIIGGDALKDVEHVKALLCKQFDMKNLGELHYFLRIEMIRNEGGIWLSQKKYGLDMLMKYGMADFKPISTPLNKNLKLRIDEGEVLDDLTTCRRIVGSLIYMTISRPDLSYAVGLVSQFMQLPRKPHLDWQSHSQILSYAVRLVSQFMPLPRKPHLDAVRHILRYVRATLDYALFYDTGTQVLEHGYTDYSD